MTANNQDIRDFVWNRTDFFENRYRKGIAAVVASYKFISEHHPLNYSPEEREFLSLYHRIKNLPGEVFSHVWQEPLAYAWSVTIYNRLSVLDMVRLRANTWHDQQQADTAEMVESQLYSQLDFFKLFVIGVIYLAKESIVFERTFKIALPFSIPGTGLVIRGDHHAEIISITDSVLKLKKDDDIFEINLDKDPVAILQPVRLEKCPLITSHNTHFYLNPFSSRFPYFETLDGEYAAAAPQAISYDEIEAIESALALFKRFYPEGFDQFCKWTRVLATKSPYARGVGSTTNTELPGLITLMLPCSRIWLAETFVHEYFHQRLFFLDEETPIMEEIPGPSIYYQPWRWDARPPLGLIHAIFVFTPVAKFFLNMYKSREFNGTELYYIADFAVRTSVRLQIGIDNLGKIDDFTENGLQLLGILKHEIECYVKEVKKTDLNLDMPAMEFSKQKNSYSPQLGIRDNKPMTVREALIEHIEHSEAGEKSKHWVEIIRQY